MGQITTINTSVTAAPRAATLQQSHALVSQGASLLAPGALAFLSQLSDLTPILVGSKAVTSISQSAGVATVTTTIAHGLTVGDDLLITIAGATPSAYDGTFLCTVTGASAFTYQVPSGTATPATGTIVYTLEDVSELLGMATTWFAQGNQVGVTVLELGAGNAADGCAALDAYITLNPNSNYTVGATGFFYAYTVPRYWGYSPAYVALLLKYDSPNAMTYFFTTATLSNYQNFTTLMKDAFVMIEEPATGVWNQNTLTGIAYTGAWGSNVLTALSWSGGLVTATTTTAHGVLPGEQFTITGCTPAGYNGTFIAAAGTTGSTLTYALASNPGAESVLGTLAASAFGSVTATTTTNHGVLPGQWFQIVGCLPAAYNGWWQAGLTTATNSLVYAVPVVIGAESVLGTLVASTVTLSGVAATEFDAAASAQSWAAQNPAPGNLLNPFAFRDLFGVTPWPPTSFTALFKTLKNAFVNIIQSGAEGGLTTANQYFGTGKDGNDLNFWYSVDWYAINADIRITAAIINGSNNPAAPLDYDQGGINTLQGVLSSLATTAVSLRIAIGQVVLTQLDPATFAQNFNDGDYTGQFVINAVPFATYVTSNPSDFKNGVYQGFSVAMTPARGFTQIIINLQAVEFA